MSLAPVRDDTLAKTFAGNRNLEKLFARSSALDMNAGSVAYLKYNKVTQAFADLYDVGIVPVTEAFVALSPNNDYHGNLRSLSSVLFAHRCNMEHDRATVTTFKAARTRAFGYVTGSVSFLDTVKGMKTTAFRHNILYPEQSRRVTVDGHMVAAWQGREDLNMKKAALILKGSQGNYRRVERGAARLARRNGIAPCQMQGVLWFTRKRLLGIRYDAQAQLFDAKDDISRTLARPTDYPPYAPLLEDWRARLKTKEAL